MFNKSTNNNQQLQEESALDSAKTHDFPTIALSPPAKGSRIERFGAQASPYRRGLFFSKHSPTPLNAGNMTKDVTYQNTMFQAADWARWLWAAFILPKFHLTPNRT